VRASSRAMSAPARELRGVRVPERSDVAVDRVRGGMDAEAISARPADEVAAWAASGAMWLTGRSDGPPLPPPAGLVSKLRSIGASIERSAGALGGPIEVDPLAVLGHRAAILGFRRQGATSCGGS